MDIFFSNIQHFLYVHIFILGRKYYSFFKKIFYATDYNATFFKFCTISLSFAEVRPQVKEFADQILPDTDHERTRQVCSTPRPNTTTSRPRPLSASQHGTCLVGRRMTKLLSGVLEKDEFTGENDTYFSSDNLKFISPCQLFFKTIYQIVSLDLAKSSPTLYPNPTLSLCYNRTKLCSSN